MNPYIPEVLKDLEKYTIDNYEDKPKSDWYVFYHEIKCDTFLEPFDYDIKKIRHLYSLNLKRRLPIHLVKKIDY